MQLYLVGSLIFAFIVAIFALWNSTEVLIRFPFMGEFTTSLALVIIGSAMLGALIIAVLGALRHVKIKLEINRLNKMIREHEATIEGLKGKLQVGPDIEGSLEDSNKAKEDQELV